jgi:SCY1-like protein 1
MIREQANKTLDTYLQRIRKFSSAMPETALPSSTGPDTPKDDARIGTSNDKSWAGWAISSFTNKLAAADGEIESSANGAKLVDVEPARSASVPRPTKPSASAQLGLPKVTPRPTAQPLGYRSRSEQAVSANSETGEVDDVYEAWGAMEDEEDQKTDDPFSPTVTTVSSTGSVSAAKPAAVPYDDGGEPDFAGWLAAQSKAKKTLPKGLSKTTSTVSPARSVSRNSASKPKTIAAAKKIDTKPKEEEVDDWGDAWD